MQRTGKVGVSPVREVPSPAESGTGLGTSTCTWEQDGGRMSMPSRLPPLPVGVVICPAKVRCLTPNQSGTADHRL